MLLVFLAIVLIKLYIFVYVCLSRVKINTIQYELQLTNFSLVKLVALPADRPRLHQLTSLETTANTERRIKLLVK